MVLLIKSFFVTPHKRIFYNYAINRDDWFVYEFVFNLVLRKVKTKTSTEHQLILSLVCPCAIVLWKKIKWEKLNSGKAGLQRINSYESSSRLAKLINLRSPRFYKLIIRPFLVNFLPASFVTIWISLNEAAVCIVSGTIKCSISSRKYNF